MNSVPVRDDKLPLWFWLLAVGAVGGGVTVAIVMKVREAQHAFHRRVHRGASGR